ncbi:MAG TPA: response regulator [Xanthobacteraceae bacterium]|nr:response regulator [Xanthobacteraceae bacterium]
MEQDRNSRVLHVLLVEDEALISEWVSQALEGEGFAVHAVANGRDALDYLDAHDDVDVLFTDINLPGDMDGARLARLARDRCPGLGVIYSSARYRMMEPHAQVPDSTFVPKPYMPSQISSLLTRMACGPSNVPALARRH